MGLRLSAERRRSPTSTRALTSSAGASSATASEALGLSQTELASRAGMTQPALSRLEAGGVVPTIPLLERISTALDADLIVEIAPHAA
jgi:transcriptional regulator with XRE-family HTH domain